MRITGGGLGGRRIKVPTAGHVRPTQDAVREALFSILTTDLPGCRFLDLFGGSGAVGIEAWSRGAASVTWVEANAGVARILADNVRSLCGEDSATTIVREDVLHYISHCRAPMEPFDIIFADPPYGNLGEEEEATDDPTESILVALSSSPLAKEGTLFIAEQRAGLPMPKAPGWARLKDRRYGHTRITIYQRNKPVERSLPDAPKPTLSPLSPMKTILFLADGMADEPLPELNNRTPLQVADTPAMDTIARRGKSGTLLTLPQGFPTSSDVANMSVIGCDLKSEYCGRGVLEAFSQGVELGPDDLAFRCNLVSIADDGTLADSAADHIAQADAEALIAELNAVLATDEIRFYPGVSYRNLLVLKGARFSADVHCEKPDDNPGNPVSEHLPTSTSPAGEQTLALMLDLAERAHEVLSASATNARLVAEGHLAANGIWLWSQGRAGSMRSLRDRLGVSGAIISAVDVIRGLGRALGMDVPTVPGATGYIDTNYEGKADAAIEAIKTHDFVYVHVESTDDVSHEGNLQLKLRSIEDVDHRLIQRVMDACGKDVRYVILPDHPVPVKLRKHTRVPVPVALCGPGIEPDSIEVYDEVSAPAGGLGALFGPELMEYLFLGKDPYQAEYKAGKE